MALRIDEEKAAQIYKLLDDANLTQRKVAAIARVSRGTVQKLIRRRGRNYSTGSSRPVNNGRRVCPLCGRYGPVPCITCEARRNQTRQSKVNLFFSDRGSTAQLDVDLMGEELDRYKRLRSVHKRFGDTLTIQEVLALAEAENGGG
jgi:hypothetical protein